MIESVLGPVSPAELGPTDCHDHLLIRGGLPIVLEPDFRLDSVEAAISETTDVLAAGGRAIVDCMPLGVGRDAEGLVRVARETGATIVAATGFHKDLYYAADHWVRDYDVDRISGLLVAEWTEGMERSGYGGPHVDRIAARPGIIKIATSADGPTQTERKLVAAVAEAAVKTGLPIISHTESPGAAAIQLDLLDRGGVPPDQVILSHMDRHSDVDALVEACATGATVCLDWMARLDRRPDEVIADQVTGLIERGYGDHVTLGQDLARRQYWRAYGGGPGLAHLFTTFVPLLRQIGLSDKEIDVVLVQTPRRVLTRRAT